MLHLKIIFFCFLILPFTHSAMGMTKHVSMVDPEISVKEALKTPGFKMVRTGRPKFKGFQEMCKLGVRRMIVMSGNGSVEENFAKTPWAQKECPGFKVIYNQQQKTAVPLSKDFLNEFDKVVEQAKKDGVGVAFRCNCGCHRTGRLAAYYRMKYLKKSAEDSVKD